MTAPARARPAGPVRLPQRQAEAAQDMKDENARLREAIAAIARAVGRRDRTELQSVIRQAAEVAGVQSALPPSSVDDDDDLEIEEVTASPEDLIMVVPAYGQTFGYLQPRARRALLLGSSSSASSTSPLFHHHQTPWPPSLSSSYPHLTNQDTTTTSHVWPATPSAAGPDPSRFLRIATPPEEIRPYLGPGANTLAGRIFWSVLDKTKTLYDEMTRMPGEGPQREVEAESRPGFIFRRMLHSSSSDSDPGTFRASYVIAIVETRSSGDSGSGRPGGVCKGIGMRGKPRGRAEKDTVHEMYKRLEGEFAAGKMGATSSSAAAVWLTPEAAERRIRRVVGEEVFRIMAIAAMDKGGMGGGGGGADGTEGCGVLLDGFLDRLSDDFVCFGTGPRWSVGVLDEALKDWFEAVADDL